VFRWSDVKIITKETIVYYLKLVKVVIEFGYFCSEECSSARNLSMENN